MKVYTELDTAIGAKLGEITALDTIEPYNQQYENTQTEDAKDYPAAYFELMEPVNWEEAGNKWQTAKIRARVHVVVFTVQRTKNKIHALGQEVFERLNGCSLIDTAGNNLTGEWTRISSSIPKRYKQLKVIKIDFEFQAFDNTAMPNNVGLGGLGVVITSP